MSLPRANDPSLPLSSSRTDTTSRTRRCQAPVWTSSAKSLNSRTVMYMYHPCVSTLCKAVLSEKAFSLRARAVKFDDGTHSGDEAAGQVQSSPKAPMSSMLSEL